MKHLPPIALLFILALLVQFFVQCQAALIRSRYDQTQSKTLPQDRASPVSDVQQAILLSQSEPRSDPTAPVPTVPEKGTRYIYHLKQSAAEIPDAISGEREWLGATVPVMLCETRSKDGKGGRPEALSLVVVEGVTYEVVGLMQLLLDSAMRRLVAELGYTREDLFEPGPNLHVSFEWAKRTDRGIPFRKWECRP